LKSRTQRLRLEELDVLHILVISASGMVLRTQVGAISRIGRQTQGVIVMRIPPDDQIVAIAPVAAIEEDSKE